MKPGEEYRVPNAERTVALLIVLGSVALTVLLMLSDVIVRLLF